MKKYLNGRNSLQKSSNYESYFLWLGNYPALVVEECAVADKGNFLAVGRPVGYIHCSLSTIYISNNLRLTTGNRHQPDIYMFVKRVLTRRNTPGEGDEYNPFPVGGDVWEPVVHFVKSHLFRVASVRFHPPNLGGSGTVGIKIQPFPVGCIFGSVVKSRFIGDLYFLPSFSRYFKNIPGVVSYSSVNEKFPVR